MRRRAAERDSGSEAGGQSQGGNPRIRPISVHIGSYGNTSRGSSDVGVPERSWPPGLVGTDRTRLFGAGQ